MLTVLPSRLKRRMLNVVAGISILGWSVAFVFGALLPVRARSFFELVAERSSTAWVLLLLVAPIAWTIYFFLEQARKRRIAREWKCSGCGYDLRATPHRCPECGLVA